MENNPVDNEREIEARNRRIRREHLSRMTFIEKTTSKDFLEFCCDVIPSTFFIILIIKAKYFTSEIPYYIEFISFFSTVQNLFIAFLFRGLFRVMMIYLNLIEENWVKFFFNLSEFSIYFFYYVSIFSGYFIFKNRPDDCFYQDLDNTSLMFSIIFTGVISFFKQSISIILILACFPILIMHFMSDPIGFYSTIGVDPQIIDNLPTFKAKKDQETNCIICQMDITEGHAILSLRCNIKHYFHGECIKAWLKRKVTCPICRSGNII